MTKLQILADIEGQPVDIMLEHAAMSGECPGICINPNCDYTTHVEPDQAQGWCEFCSEPSVRSCLSLAGMI